ncbi:MAG: isochorismatase family protein, partial [Bacteroidales bacterium]
RGLIIIDIQKGLTKKKTLYNESIFFDTVNSAIKEYRNSDYKVIFVQHNNKQLKNDSPNWKIDSRIDNQENDCVIQKNYGNAFHDTDLKTTLTDFGISSVTVCGLVSHGCVKSTCLGGLSEGFEIRLLKNGHTNWNNDAETRILETEKELIKNGVLIESTTNLSTDTDSSKHLKNLTTL